MKLKILVLCLTLAFWGNSSQAETAQPIPPTSSTSQSDDPASKIECRKISDSGRLEIDYWAIRNVTKNKVLLDFGHILRFPCENYKEKVYAFSESGEIVPLTFRKVIRPKIVFRGESKDEDSEPCFCTQKKAHLFGFCDVLHGTSNFAIDIEKASCRYAGEYSFDPQFKLKAKTVAIHIEDIKSAKYEQFKLTPIRVNNPEGATLMQQKFFLPPAKWQNKFVSGGHIVFSRNNSKCSTDDCDQFCYTKSDSEGNKPSSPNADIKVFQFSNCYLIANNGLDIIGCDDKFVCELVRPDDGKKMPTQIQGKLTLSDRSRELFIIYFQYGREGAEHILFDPKLNGIGGAVTNPANEFCGKYDFNWLKALGIKPAELAPAEPPNMYAAKGTRIGTGSGSGADKPCEERDGHGVTRYWSESEKKYIEECY
ncbi:MAG: hypothetical protein A2X86_14065 [Bdellovibrionales bacterium GWA2_49_15]|nr:MAG: hypothetical protein A2X86_14065 [Bdellovibrionales bacterium GWA2_49_15]HAZ11532.1 hypothetical protein [Bdellovibrionales bacterium]